MCDVWLTPCYCSSAAHCPCFDWWQQSAIQPYPVSKRRALKWWRGRRTAQRGVLRNLKWKRKRVKRKRPARIFETPRSSLKMKHHSRICWKCVTEIKRLRVKGRQTILLLYSSVFAVNFCLVSDVKWSHKGTKSACPKYPEKELIIQLL